MTRRLAWLLPLLVGLAAYAIAPWGGLVWDDQLVAKQQMAAFNGLRDAFLPPEGIPQWTYSYYRPLVVVSYLADQALFGRGAAAGPHVANVLYHLLATLGVYALARRLLRALPSGEWGALFAAALFAAHPIHAESVSWVTGRSDVLATLFLLPALLAVLRWRDTGSVAALLAAPLLFIAALFSKEVAVTGLALAPLLLLLAPADGAAAARPARGREAAVAWAGAVVALVGAAALYVMLRRAAGTTGGELEVHALGPAAARVLRALGWYVGKLAWPWPQSNFVPWDAVPGVAVAAVLVGLALAGAAALVVARERPGAREALVGVAWAGITIAPALAVALTGVAVTPVAERYLYLPSVGLALALGAGFARLHAAGRTVPATAAAAALVLGAGAATLARGATWQTDLRLWADAVAKTGDHAVSLIEYGKAQFQAGLAVESERSFERAAAVADTPRLRATAAYNLGVMAAMRGDGAGAERLFLGAIEADPDYAMAHYGQGRVLLEQALGWLQGGDARGALVFLARAREQQQTALRLAPALANAHRELARILAAEGEILASQGNPAGRGRLLEALDSLDRATALEPALAGMPEIQALSGRIDLLLQRAPR